MNIPPITAEAIEKDLVQYAIMVVIDFIFGLVQYSHFWFNDYINTTTLNTRYKKFIFPHKCFNRTNDLRTSI